MSKQSLRKLSALLLTGTLLFSATACGVNTPPMPIPGLEDQHEQEGSATETPSGDQTGESAPGQESASGIEEEQQTTPSAWPQVRLVYDYQNELIDEENYLIAVEGTVEEPVLSDDSAKEYPELAKSLLEYTQQALENNKNTVV